ncbi:ash family protein [Enterobacter roggenkampii]|uniref:ash family protein n=1 Tax=Enterobacter roggenkampii TaxID=1812935 RepID=UPI003D1DDBB7
MRKNALNQVLHPMHKKGLPFVPNQVYGYSAPAKSGAGIGVPELSKATHDAPSVFFCVVNSVHPFFGCAVIIRAAHKIMVGWMGASSEAPVTFDAGYANPVQSITSEIGVSGDGFYTQSKEAAKCWLLPLPKIRNSSGLSPQFAAIVRQSSLFSTMLLLRLSVMLVGLWCVITFVSSLAASLCRGRAMIKPSHKARIAAAMKSIEQASAVLIALSHAAENMEPCDISDAIDVCSGLVNEARADLAILEGEA